MATRRSRNCHVAACSASQWKAGYCANHYKIIISGDPTAVAAITTINERVPVAAATFPPATSSSSTSSTSPSTPPVAAAPTPSSASSSSSDATSSTTSTPSPTPPAAATAAASTADVRTSRLRFIADNLATKYPLLPAHQRILSDLLSKTDERTFARSYVLLSQSSAHWNLDDVNQVEDALLEALIFQLEQRWQPLFGDEKAACVQFAMEISDGEKRIRDLDHEGTLTYGEIEFSSFARVFLHHLKLKPGGIFYDLGAGSGRAVLAARMLHNFTSCRGVELLTTLYDISTKALKNYQVAMRSTSAPFQPVPEAVPVLPSASTAAAALATATSAPLSAVLAGSTLDAARASAAVLNDEQQQRRDIDQAELEAKTKKEYKWSPSSVSCQTSGIRLCNADFLEFDWTDADVIFANSTCFGKELLNKLAVKGETCRVGTYFVTFTHQISNPHWSLLTSVRYPMSWGSATVHVHQKIVPV